ncbi:MAG: EamA family transporter, partial [Reinekea sp.]|nr:EamA family transporter [Reinekea sp.]
MNRTNALLLLLLSAIWGASFLFMRVASPEFGPVTLIFLRMAIAVIVVSPLLMKKTFRQ